MCAHRLRGSSGDPLKAGARKSYRRLDLPLIGAHMSIAGGYYKAVEAAHQYGMDTVQVFTKNNNQWRAKELTDEDAAAFRSALKRLNIQRPIAHDSYLINLASPDDALWEKSIEAFRVELLRAERLGIGGVVAHPGAYVDSSEGAGIRRIIQALARIHHLEPALKTRTLLENTAGQGTNLGWRLEHLAAIIAGVAEPKRLGVCIDTCHLFAAGYPLGTPDEYESTIAQIARTVGLHRVKAFHVNDSKRELGSRVDRHEHIGQGKLGLEPFRHLLNDPRFARTPMYLETAKEEIDGEQMDAVNMRVLRSLIRAE
ncbi:MAG: deoxyribonuclease IV [Pirellulales bacterium]